MKLNKKNRQINKQRQQAFVSCWNASESKINYDALTDRFTSYYFSNYSVKKHLKKFERAAKKQPQTMQIRRMSQLLNLKFRAQGELPKYIQYDSSNKFNNQFVNTKVKQSKLVKLQKMNAEFSQNTKSSYKNKNQPLPKVKRNRVYLSKEQNLNEIQISEKMRKQKFIQYLMKKKQQIQQKKNELIV